MHGTFSQARDTHCATTRHAATHQAAMPPHAMPCAMSPSSQLSPPLLFRPPPSPPHSAHLLGQHVEFRNVALDRCGVLAVVAQRDGNVLHVMGRATRRGRGVGPRRRHVCMR
eukprot:42307-Chlamydomonas_euryale.AAC.1